MKVRLVLLWILVLVFSPVIARSEGSVSFEGVSRLTLSQDPRIKKVLVDGLDFEPTGTATRTGNHLPHGGCRVGPYSFRARQKGNKGDYDLKLTIYTDTLFTDANGSPDSSQDASHMIISLQGISLSPNGSAGLISEPNAAQNNPLPKEYLPNPPNPVPTSVGCYPSLPAPADTSKYSGGGWTVVIGNDGSYTGCDSRQHCLHIARYDWRSRGAYIWSSNNYTYSMTPIDSGPSYRLRVRDPKGKSILVQTVLPLN
jgi:hypothetical protein